MRRLIFGALISVFVLGLSSLAHAQANDITTGVGEARPNITRWTIKADEELRFRKIWVVDWAKVDEDLNVYGTKRVVFEDILDDPGTTEVDETMLWYTDLKAAIDNGNKDAKLKVATKLKLGL